MGCLGSSRAGRLNYIDTSYPEDGDIRVFEQHELGAFTKTFNSILPRICLEKDVITQEEVDNLILKDFPRDLRKAINTSFFRKPIDNNLYYDAKKIKLCLFLLTSECEVSLKKKYYDKVNLYLTLGQFYLYLY
jgi:hypothetical protein